MRSLGKSPFLQLDSVKDLNFAVCGRNGSYPPAATTQEGAEKPPPLSGLLRCSQGRASGRLPDSALSGSFPTVHVVFSGWGVCKAPVLSGSAQVRGAYP